jgi:hypothetical protein
LSHSTFSPSTFFFITGVFFTSMFCRWIVIEPPDGPARPACRLPNCRPSPTRQAPVRMNLW